MEQQPDGGSDPGRQSISFEMTSEQAAKLLGALAYDDGFRNTIRAGGRTMRDALSEYGVTLDDEAAETALTLPPKEHLQRVLRKITYPAKHPVFASCKIWAIAAYAAAAVNPDD